MISFLDELAWRGLYHQSTEGAREALGRGSVSGYIGFDPTGDSLHVGHLVQVMGLVHFQRCGHSPVALVGGGTGMIGDPSGRSAERNLISLEQVAANAESIHRQLERFLDFTGVHAARMRNNTEWLLPLTLVGFLRDVGKHFSINFMLAKDAVKSRLDTGISYTEFSYMLLQAYDFQQLYERDGVTFQMGGSDQWGNITAGTELIRRTLGGEAHGVTLPLITTADGRKFGKTADGTSVWLDPARTSPYRFYQYWINADDRNASEYLRMFTLLPREEIESLDRVLAERPESREAQSVLAFDVTERVHGTDAAVGAREASRIVFDPKSDPRTLTSSVFHTLKNEIPSAAVKLVPGQNGNMEVSVLDLLKDTQLASSGSEARRQLQQGAIAINGSRLSADQLTIPATDAIHDAFFLIRKGGRGIAIGEIRNLAVTQR